MDYDIQPMEFATLRKGGPRERALIGGPRVPERTPLGRHCGPHLAEGVSFRQRSGELQFSYAARSGGRPGEAQVNGPDGAHYFPPYHQNARRQLCFVQASLELRHSSLGGH